MLSETFLWYGFLQKNDAKTHAIKVCVKAFVPQVSSVVTCVWPTSAGSSRNSYRVTFNWQGKHLLFIAIPGWTTCKRHSCDSVWL